MGLVYADLELINADDLALYRNNHIKKSQIRKVETTTLVDSGAYMLCINEDIKTQLGISEIIEHRPVTLADSTVKSYPVVGPIIIKFENRQTVANALVLPGNSQALLGAIPIEDMDVLIDAKRGEIFVNPEHPNYAVTILK